MYKMSMDAGHLVTYWSLSLQIQAAGVSLGARLRAMRKTVNKLINIHDGWIPYQKLK